MSFVLSPGSTIAGRYVLQRLLAEGGMGQVWVAEHVVTKRRVALKFLRAGLGRDAWRRVIKEAQAACAIDHPAVLAVHDVLESETGEPALVMDLLVGEALDTHLARVGKISARAAAALFLPVAEALATAHDLGIVHRDLKPANLYLTSGGDVKVLDFGIVKKLDIASTVRDSDASVASVSSIASIHQSTATAQGALVGTPMYMSPEQALGERPVDARTDVWSLGLVLYEALSGVLPTRAAHFAQVLLIVISGKIRPIAELEPTLPPELTALVGRMLEPDADRRTISMREVAATLRALGTSSAKVPAAESPPLDVTLPSRAQSSRAQPEMASPAAAPVEPSVPRTTGRWALASAALIVLVAAGGAVFLARRTTKSPVPSPSVAATAPTRLLTEPGSKLGCSLFLASGVTAPTGWLGAATSNLACRRLQWLMGGDGARIVPAAALLELPTCCRDDAPDDPYAPPELRERSLRAGAARAAATLDGTVTASADGFHVELRLLDPEGREAGRGAAIGKTLDRAVEDASNVLAATGAFPLAARTTAEVERALGIVHPEVGWGLDLGTVVASADEAKALCARILDRGEQTSAERRLLEATCAAPLQKPAPAALPIDRSSHGALRISVNVALLSGHPLPDAKALRNELDAAASGESNLDARAALLAEAATLAGRESSSTGFAMFSELARTLPFPGAWQGIYDTPSFLAPTPDARHAYRRVAHAWAPEESNDWQPDSEDVVDAEASLRWVRRAHELVPEGDFEAIGFGRRLLMFDRFVETRALAARLLGGSAANKVAGTYLLVNADASEGFPGRAIQLALDYLEHDVGPTGAIYGSGMIPGRAMVIGQVTGTAETIADAWATRFVLTEPPRLVGYDEGLAGNWMMVCLHAKKPNRVPCLDAIARTFPHFVQAQNGVFLEGSRLAAVGDAKGAVRAFRPIAQDQRWMAWLPADVFDEAGELEIAESLDALAVATKVSRRVRGHGYEEVRMARRAWKRGDKARARVLAKELLAAWSTLDVEVPFLDELRKMGEE